MIDYFALLDEPRRPWLDTEELKEKFLKRSGDAHPDRAHGRTAAEKEEASRRYAELNAAYQCLREAKSRLAHLLALEGACKPEELHEAAPELADRFFELAKVCREVDSFLAERAKVASPVVKALLFERGQAWTDRLLALQRGLAAELEALAAELTALNATWEAAPPPGQAERSPALPLDRLERIHAAWSYLSRWSQQIQERLVQLSF